VNAVRYIATIEGQEFIIEILDEHHLTLDGKEYRVDFLPIGDQSIYSLLLDGCSIDALVYPEENVWRVTFHAESYVVEVEDEREKRLRAALGASSYEHHEFFLKAPMPGLVISVPVEQGQPVEKGEVLLVLESMKMQNELRSPRTGTVNRVRVKPGDRVEKKETLLSVV
jgi:biotin carboxyl carrier protein